LSWRVASAHIDEDRFLLPDAAAGALNVALAKARAVPAPAEVVIAADTLVVIDDQVLGKPASADRARDMLRRLAGRAHHVLSGVALRANDCQWGGVVDTRVVMRQYTEGEIERYVARGEPFDKAGGYAVQDEVFRPVERLEGCYLNVVGLPLCAVAAGLMALGESVRPGGPPPCGYCRAGADLVAVRSGS
jgi:MAF protein